MTVALVIIAVSCAILLPVLFLAEWRPRYANPVVEFFYKVLTLRRKKEYLPPQIKIEGNGIRRDLTLIEAAVLMRKPVEQILGRVLLDVSAKGALKVVGREPVRFEVGRLLPKTLTDHERDFVRACREADPKVRTRKLARLMIDLTRISSNKIRGFSFGETKRFYEQRVGFALDLVSEADRALIKRTVGRMHAFLAQVTKETNPYPDVSAFKYRRRSYSGSGSGDGGGGDSGGGCAGGCACACDGCACACACAGCACACAGGGH